MTSQLPLASRYRTCTAGEVPTDDAWLTPRERDLLARFRVRKRIGDWRLGRFTAKHAVAAALDEPVLDPGAVEIRPASNGAPTAWFDGARLPVEVSISHSGRRAVCVVTPFRLSVGCDLKRLGSRASPRERASFTLRETEWLGFVATDGTRAAWEALVRSAKESALKAIAERRNLEAKDVEVRRPVAVAVPGTEWSTFEIGEPEGERRWFGWWRLDTEWVLSVVTRAPTAAPVPLDRA